MADPDKVGDRPVKILSGERSDVMDAIPLSTSRQMPSALFAAAAMLFLRAAT